MGGLSGARVVCTGKMGHATALCARWGGAGCAVGFTAQLHKYLRCEFGTKKQFQGIKAPVVVSLVRIS